MRRVRILLSTVILFIAASCGDSTTEVVKQPGPTDPVVVPTEPIDPGETPPVDAAKDKAFAATVRNCASCHTPGVQSPPLNNEANITRVLARVCVRTANNSMPPGGGLPAGEKKLILDGFCK